MELNGLSCWELSALAMTVLRWPLSWNMNLLHWLPTILSTGDQCHWERKEFIKIRLYNIYSILQTTLLNFLIQYYCKSYFILILALKACQSFWANLKCKFLFHIDKCQKQVLMSKQYALGKLEKPSDVSLTKMNKHDKIT